MQKKLEELKVWMRMDYDACPYSVCPYNICPYDSRLDESKNNSLVRDMMKSIRRITGKHATCSYDVCPYEVCPYDSRYNPTMIEFEEESVTPSPEIIKSLTVGGWDFSKPGRPNLKQLPPDLAISPPATPEPATTPEELIELVLLVNGSETYNYTRK